MSALPSGVAAEALAAELQERIDIGARTIQEAIDAMPTVADVKRLGLPADTPTKPTSRAVADRGREQRIAAHAEAVAAGILPPTERLAVGLRAIRLARGLTQEALARKARIHDTTIWNADTCRKGPQPKTALRLARALDVEVEALFDPNPKIQHAKKSARRKGR